MQHFKKYVRKIEPHIDLYKDTRTGLAWAKNSKTGRVISVHPFISARESSKGMLSAGFWSRKDKLITTYGRTFNVSVFNCKDRVEAIIADTCECEACKKRKHQQAV
jgi:hypothetical protein